MSRRASALAGLKVIAILLAGGLIATFAVIGVPQLLGAQHSFVVLSGSMEPAISAGDVVIVDERPPEAIDVGDTITFREGRRPTTHEVVEVIADGDLRRFKTKGLANEEPDQGFVREGQLIGEVVLVIPYAGHVVLLANTEFGAALFLIVPGVLLVLNELWELAKDYRAASTPEQEVAADGD